MITNLRKAICESWEGTMTDLARYCGMSPTLLSTMVTGQRPIRPMHHLISLSRALKRNPAELVGGRELELP